MARYDDFDDGWQDGGGPAPGPLPGKPRTRRDHLPPPGYRGGAQPKKFIGYEDYARFFGVKVDTVRHWVCAGKFDPADLRSVVAYYEERRGRG